MRKKAPELDNLIGRRIRTHYGTGGVVTDYSGPYSSLLWGGKTIPGEWYTVQYRDGCGGMCWLNTIQVVDGQVLCEGKPLVIGEQVDPAQLTLF